jgi:2-hydroxychromene-2-carboxylate isomerase/rhodanese-related sulfurtransferase
MTTHIDFYFDFSSPYSYIAAEKIDALAASYGMNVVWKPFLLGAILKTTGAPLLTTGNPWKTGYSMMDFARSAETHHLPYSHPSKFPQASVTPGRCMLWMDKTMGSDKAKAFAKEVMRALFVRDGDINDVTTLTTIAKTMNIDAAAMLTAIQQADIKQLLIISTEQAITNEIFGAPIFVLNGERFWGADRLDALEQRIKTTLGGKGYQTMIDQAMNKVTTLSVNEARALHGQSDVVFVDVRDPRELEKEGVVPGAFHAPRGMIEFWVDPKSPYYKPVFKADKKYVFFCAAGWRSALTTATVQEMAVLPNIAHIDGGFAAWKKSGAPVEEKAPKV